MPPAQRTLVIGIGNELRGDDGVGRLVARRLGPAPAPGVEVREATGATADLVHAFGAVDRGFIVDAVQCGDPPGTVHRWDVTRRPLPAVVCATSTHALGLVEAIELARVLGGMPGRLVIFGVEAEDFEMGSTLSVAVAAAVDPLVDRLRSEFEERADA